eukprot:1160548-Pelagomonas_calceolata.AAC.13
MLWAHRLDPAGSVEGYRTDALNWRGTAGFLLHGLSEQLTQGLITSTKHTLSDVTSINATVQLTKVYAGHRLHALRKGPLTSKLARAPPPELN